MTSNDIIIRTERSLIDITLSNESEIKALRRDFEEFKTETRLELAQTRQEIRTLAVEVRAMDRHIDSMTTIFGWGLGIMAIAVAIAPSLREFFVYRHDKDIHDEISKQVDAKVRELMKQQS